MVYSKSVIEQWLLDNQWGSIHWIPSDVPKDMLYRAKQSAINIMCSSTLAGKIWNRIMDGPKDVEIIVNKLNRNEANPIRPLASALLLGSPIQIYFDPNHHFPYRDGSPTIPEAALVHEVCGHGFLSIFGRNPWFKKKRERIATAMENLYRHYMKVEQRYIYGKGKPRYNFLVPQYFDSEGFALDGSSWSLPKFMLKDM